MQNPVIIVPGITATELRDDYPLRPDTVWSAILNRSYERIVMHPDDLRYEAREPARIRPDLVSPLVYEHLTTELRHNLTDKADLPVPVFAFPYDWRRPLREISASLCAFVGEVRDRAKLMRHYARSKWIDEPRVDIVAHSMGGLIVAHSLAHHHKDILFGRVATLGTPYRGSLEAPIKILTGTSSLGPDAGNSSEREAARLTPSLYHLLPDLEGCVTDASGRHIDLFQSSNWQPGVTETLAETIRLLSVRPPRSATERRAEARALLQHMLDDASAFRREVGQLRLEDSGLRAEDWLCVAGVNQRTRITLKQRTTAEGAVRFDLAGEDRKDLWTSPDPLADRWQTGDGTVPLGCAVPAFLSESNLVCVSPEDFGYWEAQDRALSTFGTLHSMLPNMNLVQRLIVAHLKGQSGNDTIWAQCCPSLSSSTWSPPIRGLRLKESRK